MISSPRARYNQHKANAKARGVEFDLTFEEWWDIWQSHFSNRGRAPDQMQMCRTRDAGPYAVGNVRIDSGKNNALEAIQVRKEAYQAETRTIRSEWLMERKYLRYGYWKMRELMEEHPDRFQEDD